MTRAIAAAVAALALAGCSAPEAPVKIGSKTVAVDVEFGKRDARVAGAGPAGIEEPVDVERVPGGVVVRPAPRAGGTDEHRLRDPQACPRATGLSRPPLAEAGNAVQPPAPVGEYKYRTSGAVRIGPDTLQWGSEFTRKVEAELIGPDGDRARLVTTDSLGELEVTRVYETDAARIALASVAWAHSTFELRFTPVPAVTVLPLPPRRTDPLGQPVSTWQSVGTDPTTGTTMAVDGVVEGHERVDACGVWVHSWVAKSSVRIIGALADITQQNELKYATQYGGLVVEEEVKSQGTLALRPYDEDTTATINSDPGDR